VRFIIIGGGCYGIYHSGQLYKAIGKGKLPADTELIIVDRNAEPPALREHGTKPNFRFVQSDWQEYLRNFFGDPAQFDPARDGESVQIVPAPFAPHLMFDWLQYAVVKRLAELGQTGVSARRAGFDYNLSLPYDYTDPPTGNHFMSRAGWTCPTACIEPAKCPAVKDTRDWDLQDDLRDFVAGRLVKPSRSAAIQLERNSMSNGQTALADLATGARPDPQAYGGVEAFTCHHYVHGIGTTPARQLTGALDRAITLGLALTPAQPEARLAVATISHCHGVVATLLLTLEVRH
jgi:hypothetical protein